MDFIPLRGRGEKSGTLPKYLDLSKQEQKTVREISLLPPTQHTVFLYMFNMRVLYGLVPGCLNDYLIRLYGDLHCTPSTVREFFLFVLL